jgi:hypothetical protein
MGTVHHDIVLGAPHGQRKAALSVVVQLRSIRPSAPRVRCGNRAMHESWRGMTNDGVSSPPRRAPAQEARRRIWKARTMSVIHFTNAQMPAKTSSVTATRRSCGC